MDRSPKGREIEHVEGNPGDIVARGQKITSLGQQMLSCAETLETIKNEALGDGSQKGKAIEKLKESIGDSHEVLREAGELYEPVGPVITTYGQALEGAKPIIDNSADDCVERWATYESLPGDAEGSTTPEAGGGFAGIGGHDADSKEAKKEASENAAKKAAYDEWHESAVAFDGGYDTWEEAFDTAVNGVEDELSGAIEDSFWDNISSFVSVVGTILSWAALIVGVIAIFVTGLVVLAAILAVLAFAVVAIQYLAGEKSGWDVALAAVAIIPVGKLTNLVKLAQVPKLARGAGGIGNAGRRAWGAVRGGPIDDLVKAGPGSFKVALRSGDEMLSKALGPTLSEARKPLIQMYVGNRAALAANLGYVRVSARTLQVLETAGVQLGHYGRIHTVGTAGGLDLPKVPDRVGDLV